VFRLLRLLNLIKGCEVIALTLNFAKIQLVTVVAILFVLIFFFANISVVIFKDFPSISRYSSFQDVSSSVQMLFILMTGDDWTGILGTMLEHDETMKGAVILYLLSFMIVVTFIMVNLFIMVVCESFEVLSNETKKHVERTLPYYQAAWATLDRNATGFAPEDKLEEILKCVPAPFGVPFPVFYDEKSNAVRFQTLTQKVAFVRKNLTPSERGMNFHEVIFLLVMYHAIEVGEMKGRIYVRSVKKLKASSLIFSKIRKWVARSRSRLVKRSNGSAVAILATEKSLGLTVIFASIAEDTAATKVEGADEGAGAAESAGAAAAESAGAAAAPLAAEMGSVNNLTLPHEASCIEDESPQQSLGASSTAPALGVCPTLPTVLEDLPSILIRNGLEECAAAFEEEGFDTDLFLELIKTESDLADMPALTQSARRNSVALARSLRGEPPLKGGAFEDIRSLRSGDGTDAGGPSVPTTPFRVETAQVAAVNTLTGAALPSECVVRNRGGLRLAACVSQNERWSLLFGWGSSFAHLQPGDPPHLSSEDLEVAVATGGLGWVPVEGPPADAWAVPRGYSWARGSAWSLLDQTKTPQVKFAPLHGHENGGDEAARSGGGGSSSHQKWLYAPDVASLVQSGTTVIERGSVVRRCVWVRPLQPLASTVERSPPPPPLDQDPASPLPQQDPFAVQALGSFLSDAGLERLLKPLVEGGCDSVAKLAAIYAASNVRNRGALQSLGLKQLHVLKLQHALEDSARSQSPAALSPPPSSSSAAGMHSRQRYTSPIGRVPAASAPSSLADLENGWRLAGSSPGRDGGIEL
jgi:hypothetical protein